jgi:hypothetical protein
MKRLLRKALRWLAVILITLIALLLAFYAEEDWRGAHDWAACQRDLAAKGETLDLRQLVPLGNPAADLSKVPIFAPLFAKNPDAQSPINQLNFKLNAPSSVSEPNLSIYLKRRPLNLEQWQNFYRSLPDSGLASETGTPAQDVLQVLSRFSPQMEQIDTALSNSNAYFPFDYDHPSKSRPAMQSLMQMVVLWQLRAIAHLENNETESAEKDYLSTFKLMPSLLRVEVLFNMSLGLP